MTFKRVESNKTDARFVQVNEPDNGNVGWERKMRTQVLVKLGNGMCPFVSLWSVNLSCDLWFQAKVKVFATIANIVGEVLIS